MKNIKKLIALTKWLVIISGLMPFFILFILSKALRAIFPTVYDWCSVLSYVDYRAMTWRDTIIDYTLLGLLFLPPMIGLLIIILAAQKAKAQNIDDKQLKPHFVSRAIIFIAIIAVFCFTIFALNTARVKSYDAKRVADLKQVQTAIELYFNEYNKLPVVDGDSALERWGGLGQILDESEFMNYVPNDHCVKEQAERSYDYRLSPDREDYVVRALLYDSSTSFLDNEPDKDSWVYNVWCGEPKKEIELCFTRK